MEFDSQEHVFCLKIVGLGLETVFQLIQESHSIHPGLCVKALTALLNILEGQHPQSLKKEPISVIGKYPITYYCSDTVSV